MRRKELNNLVKLVIREKKKNNSDYDGITFNPTIEECDHLYSKGITSIHCVGMYHGMATGEPVYYDATGHGVEI